MVLWNDDGMTLLTGSDRLPVLNEISLDLTVEQVFSRVRSQL